MFLNSQQADEDKDLGSICRYLIDAETNQSE